MGYGWLVWTVLAAALASWAFDAAVRLVWRPRAVERRLRAQGVRGPGYGFFHGNLRDVRRLRAAGAAVKLDVGDHDFIPIAQPQFREWIPRYGRVFLYWFGTTPDICVGDYAMAKQVLADRTGLFPKNRTNANLLRLLGDGLVLTNGEDWQRHKRVVHPAFNMDKLKMMTATMADCARSMVTGWEADLASQQKKGCRQVTIELSDQFEELTADVISHTAFGSSYKEGKQVFQCLKELQFITFSTLFSVQIPGFRYLPTEKNRRVWKLDKEVRTTLMKIIKNRLAAKEKAGYGNDLLGLMLEACAPEHGEAPLLTMDEIIDECKTFFFAGQETTSHLLTWVMFLLSTHPEWQDKLREEVRRECGDRDHPPTHDMLNKLKLMNLFILETLRLYSPVPLIRRRTTSPVELGGVVVPEDSLLTIPIATLHRDREVWGDDAGEFNPLRFDAGTTKTAPKNLSALLAFSSGPRSCIGQNFAMIETRAAIAAILQRFKLELSPEYVHAPTDVITLRPKYGLPMIVTSADA
ncbi:hypothetical protein HU200_045940 [Digitaria exilis]|uniref:Cytochrome P450 n=1 Tax=Digitaria exilis TaxID=1010633 RepID=A0A835EE55_9POAL|nr:hypothetical protein HU200_045940 [Digitaria exilis]CAB3458724.1 unnamed protein product [Digitaria exilis]